MTAAGPARTVGSAAVGAALLGLLLMTQPAAGHPGSKAAARTDDRLVTASTPAASGPPAPTPAELEGRVDSLVTSQMRHLHLPGLAVVIIRDGEVVLEKGYGTTGADAPVTIDTEFVLGSTSKQLTGLAVQRLAAEGRVDLDAPVRTLLPGFGTATDATGRITSRMLLAQTSGLAAGSSRTQWDGAGGGDTLQENAMRLSRVSLDRQPGTSFEYADANYDVLGAVVEVASGQSFEAYLHDRVLAPMGMTRTFADLTSARAAGLADGFYRWFGIWNAPMDLPFARSAVPSSYIVSTARDQAALLSRRLHEQTSDHATDVAMSASLEPLSRVDQWSSYASGWFVHPFWPSQPPGSAGTEPGVPVMYGHSGTAISYRSFMAFSPQAHYGIVVLTNRDDEVTPSGFDIFTDQLTRSALGTQFPPYRTTEDAIRRYSSALLVGLPLLQLSALLVVARVRRRGRFAVSVAAGSLVTAGGLWLLLVYVPAQSTLPLLATWQTLPDVACVTAACLALAALLIAVVVWRVRRTPPVAGMPR